MPNEYLNWGTQKISDFSTENVSNQYGAGFLFVRTGKGDMIQTRSLRVRLNGFEFNSENRRILKVNSQIIINHSNLPLPLDNYDWHIHKMGALFYREKFGEGTFSANTIRALITNPERTNFTSLLTYKDDDKEAVGQCICYENDVFLHYAYPFYDFKTYPGMGMAMMTKAVNYAMTVYKSF